MKEKVQEADKETRDNNIAELTEKIENSYIEKYGEEAFEEKINSIISLSHGNTDTAHKIYEFLKSDEFKSFFKD